MNEVYVQEQCSDEVKFLEVSSCSDTNPVAERVRSTSTTLGQTGDEVSKVHHFPTASLTP